MIYDALGSTDSKGIYGIDVEALSRNARAFAESWKAGWSGMSGKEKKESKAVAAIEVVKPNQPKPRDWLRYSRQHNLRIGMLSLFAGLGSGIALYFISRPPFIYDILASIEPLANANVDIGAIARITTMVWLFAAIPVLKGLAQILYAVCFAESIKTLTERFVPAPVQVVTAPQLGVTAPQEDPVLNFEAMKEPVSSVTEHTTQIINGPRGVERA
jgi:hypothetical protein